MKIAKSFLLQGAVLTFQEGNRHKIKFTGPSADSEHTHITLLCGPNGTSKSRILASIVEKLCQIENSTNEEKYPAIRHRTQSPHGLTCEKIDIHARGQSWELSEPLPLFKNTEIPSSALPSKILVLSNLVMDKFHYPQRDQNNEVFYNYLGVRQASNLTTTGSLEKAVSEAMLNMLVDRQRIDLLTRWMEVIFPGGREIAFTFPKIRSKEIENFLRLPNKHEYLRDRYKRRFGDTRPKLTDPQHLETTIEKTVELFEFLKEKAQVYDESIDIHRRENLILRLNAMTASDAKRFSSLAENMQFAQSAGFYPWPSLTIEAKPWLPFSQLSSGEQNLLSVGIKLISYASPGCLIAIDEPEVSLNVVWQQKYIDLIWHSLQFAPQSHVLIATHSPHLIASLPVGKSSLLTIEKDGSKLSFNTEDATFEGWGSESILYQVLGIPSASSYLFQKELAVVLKHIQQRGENKRLINSFLDKTDRINYAGIEPLEIVIKEIRSYINKLQ